MQGRAADEDAMTDISYQLYSSRHQPLETTLSMLAETGYTQVEGHGGLFTGGLDPAELRQALDARGLRMTTAHMALEMVEGDPLGTVELARALGIGTVFVPSLAAQERPTDAEGWVTFGRRLALAGKPLQTEGIGFGWHNHDFEFQVLDAADRPLDLILSGGADLAWEIDAAWLHVAGEDPLEWIGRYAGRIPAAHVKDVAAEGASDEEGGWADPGHGVMDWPAIARALREAGCRTFVVEHDDPSDDARFARRAIETARAL
jgi:sugar phosphate isomerase/epimerase